MNEVIRFNYLYRDSGNYKKFGSKRFSNPEQLSIEEITQILIQNLIDGSYFYPEQVGIKKFNFHRHTDDTSWYEFESIEILDNVEPQKKQFESINSFILKLKKKPFT